MGKRYRVLRRVPGAPITPQYFGDPIIIDADSPGDAVRRVRGACQHVIEFDLEVDESMGLSTDPAPVNLVDAIQDPPPPTQLVDYATGQVYRQRLVEDINVLFTLCMHGHVRPERAPGEVYSFEMLDRLADDVRGEMARAKAMIRPKPTPEEGPADAT